MGAVLDVPAAALPWSVEVCERSSYLSLHPETRPMVAARRRAWHVVCSFAADRAAALAVAVDVVLAHPLLAAHQEPIGWTAVASGSVVTVEGPGLVFFAEPSWMVCLDGIEAGEAWSLQVEHEWLAGLRRALAPWSPCPRG